MGKSRTGAEWLRREMLEEPRIAGIIGMTIGAVRTICIEGPAGLIEICAPGEIQKYNKSTCEILFTNGSKVYGFGATNNEKLRGFQCHRAWYDELAAWQDMQLTYDMGRMGLRLTSSRPDGNTKCVITTTPKPSPLIVSLVKQATTDSGLIITTGSTFNNAANLDEKFLNQLREKYEGTTLGRQELYADLILEDPGALWSQALIDLTRVDPSIIKKSDMTEIVVAIDPSMSQATERETETGIIVAGRHKNGDCYILEDCSLLRPSPDAWGRLAIQKYHEWQANRIVAEVNQGFDLVTNLLNTIDDTVPVKKVYAVRGGKYTRAEPIAALMEQGKVHHAGMYLELEQQMRSWVPGKQSPDRLDAMVWAVTQLMLGGGIADIYSPMSLPRLPRIV